MGSGCSSGKEKGESSLLVDSTPIPCDKKASKVGGLRESASRPATTECNDAEPTGDDLEPDTSDEGGEVMTAEGVDNLRAFDKDIVAIIEELDLLLVQKPAIEPSEFEKKMWALRSRAQIAFDLALVLTGSVGLLGTAGADLVHQFDEQFLHDKVANIAFHSSLHACHIACAAISGAVGLSTMVGGFYLFFKKFKGSEKKIKKEYMQSMREHKADLKEDVDDLRNVDWSDREQVKKCIRAVKRTMRSLQTDINNVENELKKMRNYSIFIAGLFTVSVLASAATVASAAISGVLVFCIHGLEFWLHGVAPCISGALSIFSGLVLYRTATKQLKQIKEELDVEKAEIEKLEKDFKDLCRSHDVALE